MCCDLPVFCNTDIEALYRNFLPRYSRLGEREGSSMRRLHVTYGKVLRARIVGRQGKVGKVGKVP